MGINSVLRIGVLIVLAFSGSARADRIEPPMMSISGDMIKGTTRFAVTTDAQGDFTGLLHYKDLPPAEKLPELATSMEDNLAWVTLDALPKGRVLIRKSKRDAVTLVATAFDPKNGGEIWVRYLKNGLTGTYNNFVMELVRIGDHWEAFEKYRGRRASKPFTSMYLQDNRLFGKMVGIGYIRVK